MFGPFAGAINDILQANYLSLFDTCDVFCTSHQSSNLGNGLWQACV